MKRTITKITLTIAVLFTALISNGQYYDKLTESAFGTNESFGKALAFDDTLALVAKNTGRVFFYRKTNAGWIREQYFSGTNPFGVAYSAMYRSSPLAIQGNQAFIGAYNSKTVHYYEYDGSSWSLTQSITSSGNSSYFGCGFAVDGNLMVVGAPNQSVQGGNGKGEAYLFEFNGTNWIEKARFIPSDTSGGGFTNFGSAVAISGNKFAITAPTDNDLVPGGGAVYTYEWDGTNVNETQKIAPDAQIDTNAYFGSSISIDGNRLVIGGMQVDNAGYDQAGKAFLYEWGGSTWALSHTFVPSTVSVASNDYFYGQSVAIKNDRVLIGQQHANTKGRLFKYDYTGSSWAESIVLPAEVGTGDYFGREIGISEKRAITGAFFDDDRRSNAGAAYVFDFCANTGPSQSHTFCSGETFVYDGNTYYGSTTFKEYLTNTDGCDSIITHNLSKKYPQSVSFTQSDSILCVGDTLMLSGSGSDTIKWNNGVINDTAFTVSTNDTFVVYGITEFGCTITDTAFITINLLPTLDLGEDKTICDTISIELNPGDFDTYAWQNNDSTSTQTVDGSNLGEGTYNYTVEVTDSNGCKNSDLVTITIEKCTIDTSDNNPEGIKDLENSSISVYPNPSYGVVYIENKTTEPTAYFICNIVGEKMEEGILNANATESISFTNYQKGVYFIQTKNETFKLLLK